MRSLRLKVYDPDLTELLDRSGGPHCLTFEPERDEDQRQPLLEVGRRLKGNQAMLVEQMTWEEYRDEVSRRIIIIRREFELGVSG